jgi:hypothetical protein
MSSSRQIFQMTNRREVPSTETKETISLMTRKKLKSAHSLMTILTSTAEIEA